MNNCSFCHKSCVGVFCGEDCYENYYQEYYNYLSDFDRDLVYKEVDPGCYLCGNDFEECNCEYLKEWEFEDILAGIE